MAATLKGWRGMASLFPFNRSPDEEDEILLGTPDMSEAQSLERHVDRCAMRYRMFTKRLRNQSGSIKRIEIAAYGVLIWIVATSEPAREAAKFLFHF